jgi:hypothetical protein
MYLIFKPSEDKKEIENIGLNDAVPQATGAGMPDDKGKAYEQEMLERKEQEKRNALPRFLIIGIRKIRKSRQMNFLKKRRKQRLWWWQKFGKKRQSCIEQLPKCTKHIGFILSGRQFGNNGTPQASGRTESKVGGKRCTTCGHR